MYHSACVEIASVRVLEEEGYLNLAALRGKLVSMTRCPSCGFKLYTKNGLSKYALARLLHTSPLFENNGKKIKLFWRSPRERAFRFLFRDFVDGASEILYGPPWAYKQPEGFSPLKFEYMRTVRENDDITYMVVFDLDNKDELTQDLLDAMYGLYDGMGGIGALKASGTGGLHYMPCYFQFPIGTSEEDAVASLDAWSESLLATHIGDMGYKVTYGKQGSFRIHSGNVREEKKPIDSRMFERSRKVRGFCARFTATGDAANSTGLFSVPIDRGDDVNTVTSRMKLEISTDDRFHLPVFFWSPELMRAEGKALSAPRRKGRPYYPPQGEEELNEMFQPYWRIMPRRLKASWTTPDPTHEENFAVAAWLNLQMVDEGKELEERIGLIAAFIDHLMPREGYRSAGKHNPDITAMQVRQICSRGDGKGYMPPKWVWEKA